MSFLKFLKSLWISLWDFMKRHADALQVVATFMFIFVTGSYVILTNSMVDTMQEAHQSINRGYVGIVKFEYDSMKPKMLKARLKNFGNSPAKIHRRTILIDDQFTACEPEGVMILFPNEEHLMTIFDFEDEQDHKLFIRCDYNTLNQDRYTEYEFVHSPLERKTIISSVDSN